ncbi:hypothetical protein BC936DRAFT_145242 [Jimgerdemannia flammicorona]|uniref:Uncharacterized protein n=1 Tax=Jimgerdemannia flammicorona TaxID=994334 RepID=A0A433DAK2_9FUNG|nr:hypothetical protein BC936DRAFT_145242 [Jimgerdemannia flammicorona]
MLVGVFTNSDPTQPGCHAHVRRFLAHVPPPRLPETHARLRRRRLHQYRQPLRGFCTAAAFLKEFVLGLETPVESTEEEASTPTAVVVVKEEGGTIRWANIDIAGVMESKEAA